MVENNNLTFDEQLADLARLTTKAFLSGYYYVLIVKRKEYERWLAKAGTPAEICVDQPYETAMDAFLQALDYCNYDTFRESLDDLCIETPSILSLDIHTEDDCPRVAALLSEYPYLIEIENKYSQLISADKANHLQGSLLQIACGLYDSLNDMAKSHLRLVLIALQGGLTDDIEEGLAGGPIGEQFGSMACSAIAAGLGRATTHYIDDELALSVSKQDRAFLDEAMTFQTAWEDLFRASIMKTGEFYHTLYQALYEAEVTRCQAFYHDVKSRHPQIADTFFPEYLGRRVEDNNDELDYPFEDNPELTFRKMINTVEDYFRSNGVNPSASSLV